MSSKEIILNRLGNHGETRKALPEIIYPSETTGNLQDAFENQLRTNHVDVFRTYSFAEHEHILNTVLSSYKFVFSSIAGFQSTSSVSSQSSSAALKEIDVCAIAGGISVAENGAIFIADESIPHRALPFIVEHLVVWIDKKNIVSNMHEAYQKADKESGYSFFVAGPSKTADIEQSLVIGAHGPKKMTVIIKSCDNVL